jgi:hypothetical protein
MQKGMDDMSQDCQAIEFSLKKAFENTSGIVSHTITMEQKQYLFPSDCRKEVEAKKKIAVAFLARFTVDAATAKILQASQINKEYFSALERVQQIHNDCNVLLISEQQTLGMEIMEKMSNYQEMAYERLFKWTQHECRSMKYEAPEVSSELKRAMHAFRLRPILFDTCIDEIASIRYLSN